MTRAQFGIFGALFLLGCTTPIAYTTSYLFPIQGPTSTQRPIPVIPVSVENDVALAGGNVGFMAGDISFSLPDGETFRG